MRITSKLATIVFLCILTVSSPAFAGKAAKNVVQDMYSALTATMKQGEQLGFEGRRKKLDPVIRAAYNMQLMAKMSVGSNWNTASPSDQSAMIEAFSAFSVATYASRFASYDGEQFTVTGEKPVGKDIMVETTLKPKDSEAVTLNYLMRKDEKGDYRIVDVMMNGTISELATRRAEFSSIARREGMTALINSLRDKAGKMGSL